MRTTGPIPYLGGKYYAWNFIKRLVPAHTHYVEVFAGGAKLFFAKPKARHNLINDINPELYALYICVRDHPKALYEQLVEMMPDCDAKNTSMVDWAAARSTVKKMDAKGELLLMAARMFFLCRTGFGGNPLGGYSHQKTIGKHPKPYDWHRPIKSSSAKLQGVKITKLDFEQVIDGCPDNSFIFLDPLYRDVDTSALYEYTLDDCMHHRLCECIKRNNDRIKWLMTYDNCPWVRDAYKWASCEEYHLRSNSGGQSKEVMIGNVRSAQLKLAF